MYIAYNYTHFLASIYGLSLMHLIPPNSHTYIHKHIFESYLCILFFAQNLGHSLSYIQDMKEYSVHCTQSMLSFWINRKKKIWTQKNAKVHTRKSTNKNAKQKGKSKQKRGIKQKCSANNCDFFRFSKHNFNSCRKNQTKAKHRPSTKKGDFDESLGFLIFVRFLFLFVVGWFCFRSAFATATLQTQNSNEQKKRVSFHMWCQQTIN